MGNITGAMVFQSCLPTVLGLLFTDVDLHAGSALAFASAGVAFVSTILIFGHDAAPRPPTRLVAADRWAALPALRRTGAVHAARRRGDAPLALHRHGSARPPWRRSRRAREAPVYCPRRQAGATDAAARQLRRHRC